MIKPMIDKKNMKYNIYAPPTTVWYGDGRLDV